jgi:hypothetical protein
MGLHNNVQMNISSLVGDISRHSWFRYSTRSAPLNTLVP